MAKVAIIGGLAISKALLEELASHEIEVVDPKKFINLDNEFVLTRSDVGLRDCFDIGLHGGKQKAQWKQETNGFKRK